MSNSQKTRCFTVQTIFFSISFLTAIFSPVYEILVFTKQEGFLKIENRFISQAGNITSSRKFFWISKLSQTGFTSKYVAKQKPSLKNQ